MATYTPDVIYICSVYPGELAPIRRYHGVSPSSGGKGASRSTLYQLEPVKRGSKPGYFILPVSDAFEEVLDVVGMGARPGQRQRPRISKPVPVQEIVDDLLKEWTGGLFNVPTGAKPGIGQIVGTVPQQAELRILEQQQKMYFEYLFSEGAKAHKENNWKDITDTMRLAAQYLGHKTIWSDPAIARESIPCPFCQEMITREALVCAHCAKTVRAIPPELAKLQNVPAGV